MRNPLVAVLLAFCAGFAQASSFGAALPTPSAYLLGQLNTLSENDAYRNLVSEALKYLNPRQREVAIQKAYETIGHNFKGQMILAGEQGKKFLDALKQGVEFAQQGWMKTIADSFKTLLGYPTDQPLEMSKLVNDGKIWAVNHPQYVIPAAVIAALGVGYQYDFPLLRALERWLRPAKLTELEASVNVPGRVHVTEANFVPELELRMEAVRKRIAHAKVLQDKLNDELAKKKNEVELILGRNKFSGVIAFGEEVRALEDEITETGRMSQLVKVVFDFLKTGTSAPMLVPHIDASVDKKLRTLVDKRRTIAAFEDLHEQAFGAEMDRKILLSFMTQRATLRDAKLLLPQVAPKTFAEKRLSKIGNQVNLVTCGFLQDFKKFLLQRSIPGIRNKKLSDFVTEEPVDAKLPPTPPALLDEEPELETPLSASPVEPVAQPKTKAKTPVASTSVPAATTKKTTKPKTAMDKPTTKKSLSTLGMVGIVVGVVAVLGGGAAAFMHFRRKSHA